MSYITKVKHPIFGKEEIKYWATSKQSYNKYFDKSIEAYNCLMNPDLDITISKIDHIEIVRAEIKFFFTSVVSKKNVYQFSCNNLYFTCIKNQIYVI